VFARPASCDPLPVTVGSRVAEKPASYGIGGHPGLGAQRSQVDVEEFAADAVVGEGEPDEPRRPFGDTPRWWPVIVMRTVPQQTSESSLAAWSSSVTW
jgi:hypothetical protein